MKTITERELWLVSFLCNDGKELLLIARCFICILSCLRFCRTPNNCSFAYSFVLAHQSEHEEVSKCPIPQLFQHHLHEQ
jgi:hypothetical protein